jgi:hypothetical protein
MNTMNTMNTSKTSEAICKDHITFLNEHGVKDAQKYLTSHCSDLDLFIIACERDVMQYVPDWRLFLKNLKTLNQKPFHKELYGEDIKNVIRVRTTIAPYTKGYHNENIQARRLAFCAWVLFETRKNQVYLPIHTIRAFCDAHRVDLSDLFDVLVQHPTYKNMYTSKDIRQNELNIEKWLSKATHFNVPFKPSPTLDDTQNAVVRAMTSQPYSALQGNAGCGKTTTICEVIDQFLNSDEGIDVIAAAYTHKAKKCIHSKLQSKGYLNVMVSTVHSLIAMLKALNAASGAQQQVPSKPPIKKLLLILDEASMLDIDLLGELAYAMMDSNGMEYQLCFVGDFFQIQPVGRGELFRMIVQKGHNVHTLTKCYRTDHTDLFQAYNGIRSGSLPLSTQNFHVHHVDNDKEVSSQVGKYIMRYNDEYQIICWQNKHIWMINQWVQKALLKAGKIGPPTYRGLYVGDRIVYTGENGEIVTNSMLGVVHSTGKSSVSVQWEGIENLHTYTDVKDLQLAYAISAHKSQGSEYKKVLVAMYDIDKMTGCMDRRWFYTSVTRGQDKVVVITPPGLTEFVSKALNKTPICNINI